MTIEQYCRTRCELAEECLQESPCDPDITAEQIRAHSIYNEFVMQEHEALGDYQVIGTAEMVEPSEKNDVKLIKWSNGTAKPITTLEELLLQANKTANKY